MTKPIRLVPDAERELRQAADHYGAVRPELRARFLVAIDDAFARMVRLGRHLATVPAAEPGPPIRRIAVRRFPFAVYFTETASSIRVFAVAHTRQRPYYWRGRVG